MKKLFKEFKFKKSNVIKDFKVINSKQKFKRVRGSKSKTAVAKI